MINHQKNNKYLIIIIFFIYVYYNINMSLKKDNKSTGTSKKNSDVLPKKVQKITDSFRTLGIDVLEIAILLLGLVPLGYMIAMTNNKIMSFIVPEGMTTLTLPYAYIYSLIIVVQSAVLKDILAEYITNPKANAAVSSIINPYQGAFTIYGKNLTNGFVLKTI